MKESQTMIKPEMIHKSQFCNDSRSETPVHLFLDPFFHKKDEKAAAFFNLMLIKVNLFCIILKAKLPAIANGLHVSESLFT